MALPQRAEIRDCLGILSNPRIVCKKRGSATLSRDTLEYQPVYYDDKKYQYYCVYDPSEQKGSKSHSRTERSRAIIYLSLAPVTAEILIRTEKGEQNRDL